MTFSLLQLNINADNFWDKLTTYLTVHEFDIIQLQEIAGPGTKNGNINCQRDTFKELQILLHEKYLGELAIAETFTSAPKSYFGNATFYKKNHKLLIKNIIYLHKNNQPFPSESKEFDQQGRNLLHLQLNINGKTIDFINTHLAWGPNPSDTPMKLKQGQKLVGYIKKIKTPFVLSGDFNVESNSHTVKQLEIYAENLTAKNNITNTLNPNLHNAKHLFPTGLAVDFIFASTQIHTNNFQIITQDLSDHYAITANFSI